MNGQPQVDIEIINKLLISNGKKKDSPFILNRLDKAVSALEKHDPKQGYSARALYFSYINEPKKAINFISNVINKYGKNKEWLESKVSVARKYGNWEVCKKIFEEYFRNILPEEINDELLTAYIHDSIMYVDSSADFEYILRKYKVSNSDSILNDIIRLKETLCRDDLSLETYRRVLEISYSCIDRNYNVTTSASLRISNNIQVIHNCEIWTVNEAIELTKEINDAILEVDNVDFQLEADEIEVFCINFSPDNLPEDFSLYDDDNEDQELVKLIQSRMDSNPTREAFDA